MRSVSSSAIFKPESFVGPHTLVVVNVESSADGAIDVPADDDVTWKEVAVLSLDPQNTDRRKFGLP